MTGASNVEAQPEQFVISRELDAPRALVWKAFAEPARLAQWWGPKGYTLAVLRHEFRPGGYVHYRMDGPNGFTMWARFEYREIAEPARIVFVSAFSDESGGLARAPFFDGKWPLEVLVTVTLAEQDGTTMVTLRSHPIDATDVERQTFTSNLDSMGQGFGSAFDQLREHLAREQAG